MKSQYDVFVQLPNAKVSIGGIRDLKQYLVKVKPTFDAMPVIKFTTVGSEVFVHILNDVRGHVQKKFFGYIEDVALNAQKGLYEEATE